MQTARSEGWRPGFAKRAENFSDVCAQADGWRGSPGETIARVAAAVLKGTPGLTIPQRMTLFVYVEHLNRDRLEANLACVWPSAHLVALYLGCSESQARANWRALEVGRLATQDRGAANLRLNLARILKVKGEVPPPPPVEDTAAGMMFAPGVEDPPWPEIAGHLRAMVREGAWGSWFGRVGFHGIVDGILTLSTPTGIAADRIKHDYVAAVLQAAQAAEVLVERVVVWVRKR